MKKYLCIDSNINIFIEDIILVTNSNLTKKGTHLTTYFSDIVTLLKNDGHGCTLC